MMLYMYVSFFFFSLRLSLSIFLRTASRPGNPYMRRQSLYPLTFPLPQHISLLPFVSLALVRQLLSIIFLFVCIYISKMLFILLSYMGCFNYFSAMVFQSLSYCCEKKKKSTSYMYIIILLILCC